MGLVRKAGVKINNIFLTRLRHLIKINLVPKLVALLRCQRQELISSGDYLVIGFRMEVLLEGPQKSNKQLEQLKFNITIGIGMIFVSLSLERTHVHPFCSKLKTEDQRIMVYYIYYIYYYILHII